MTIQPKTLALPLLMALCGPAWAQDAPADGEEAAVEEPAAPVTRSYTLDPSASWLYVMVFNDDTRWTPVSGHTHGIRATTFTGTVLWNEADASACKVDISFPVSALAVDPTGMRSRAGLSEDGAIGDGAKKTVVGNLAGKSQLDAANTPNIRYSSSSCDGTTGSVKVSGALNVHGVSKSITVPMTVTLDGDSFAAKGQIELSHADFGMKPFTYGPGTPKNQEKLVFVVDVVGTAN